jgi:hypothetical protein
MPARARTVEPRVSRYAANVIRGRMSAKGWTTVELSARMYAAGYPLSAAVIGNILNGITEFNPRAKTIRTRVRHITLDEISGFADVLGVSVLEFFERK